jgi:hypothetical protein
VIRMSTVKSTRTLRSTKKKNWRRKGSNARGYNGAEHARRESGVFMVA